MAPRKRGNKSVQNVEEKVNKKVSYSAGMKASKARVVTSQKLKAPSILDIKISKSRIVTNRNLNKNEIKVMLANEVVQAHFQKKPTHNECNQETLPVKRKITPKKMMDGYIADTKKMRPFPIITMDSNVVGDGGDVIRNGPVKRCHSTNSVINNTNPKIKKKETRKSKKNSPVERRDRKRIGSDKKEIIPDVCNDDLLTASKQNANKGSGKDPEKVRVRKPSDASECLSWTKDISSSSTTTCFSVSTNDYVCLDNRIPMIKLTNICKQLKTENTGDKKVESSSDIEGAVDITNLQNSHDDGRVSPTLRSRSLSLSSSSSSSSSNSDSSRAEIKVTPERHEALDEALDKLTSNLRKFDLEIMKWIGYENEIGNAIKKDFRGKVFEVLKEEGDVISMCRNIKKLLLDEDHQCLLSSYDEKDSSQTDEKNEEFVKPGIAMELKSDKELNRKEATIDHVLNNLNNKDDTKNCSGESHSFDDRCNDDDDALSLYAESISGFDSFRKSTGVSNEEYIPHPISKSVQSGQSVTYMPTKITDRKIHEDSDLCGPHQKTKSICEKQNADSTSIFKDPQFHDSQLLKSSDESTNSSESCERPFKDSISVATPVTTRNGLKPNLMSSMYEGINCVKSVVFGGVCFFNLILSCKKPRCRFVHAYIDFDVIKLRLAQVNEEMFIKEYMFIRNWPILRRKYGLLFVSEAINRELTRIAIEMAMDFVTKATQNNIEDCKLRVEVLEQVLLYLNNVDIKTFSDLLLFNIKNEECICDIFMETLAETQNFSRFKTIFINLTNFMFRNGRQFSLNVATLLLERVCILPFEEALILALLNILRRTSPGILQNSMIPHLERSLSPHKELFDQLQEIKNFTPSSWDYRVVTPTPAHYDLNQTNSVILKELDKRCSPDTTNFDHLTKTHRDSVVSPAIDLNRAWLFDQSKGFAKESSVPSLLLQNNAIEQRPHFQRWKNRSIFDKVIMVSNTNAGTSLRRPMGRSFKRQIDPRVQYGDSPSKYQRRFGPDFLGDEYE